MGKLTDIPADKAVKKGSGAKPSPTSKSKGKTPNFTPKETKFLKGMVEEVIPGKKTKQKLAMEVYGAKTPGTASAIASENLKKPKFQEALAEAFEKAGINTDRMATVLADAMTATKTASVNGMVFPSDEPDHSVRVSAVKAAASIIGTTDDDGKGGNTFNFNLNSGTQNFIKRSDS